MQSREAHGEPHDDSKQEAGRNGIHGISGAGGESIVIAIKVEAHTWPPPQAEARRAPSSSEFSPSLGIHVRDA